MYQSPIEIIYDNMRMKIEGEVYKAVQRVGVNVDKEELLKALQYDRGQYKRGYEDGYAKAIEEFAEILHGREFGNAYGTNIVLTPKEIDEIAMELKGE